MTPPAGVLVLPVQFGKDYLGAKLFVAMPGTFPALPSGPRIHGKLRALAAADRMEVERLMAYVADWEGIDTVEDCPAQCSRSLLRAILQQSERIRQQLTDAIRELHGSGLIAAARVR